MSSGADVYYALRTTATISRHDRRIHTRSRIDFSRPYPSMIDLMERAERRSGEEETFPEWYTSDAVFRFAIRAHMDWLNREIHPSQGSVLRRLLTIGIYNWEEPNKKGEGACPATLIRYAAVLGNELLKRIEVAEDRVRFPRIPKSRKSS